MKTGLWGLTLGVVLAAPGLASGQQTVPHTPVSTIRVEGMGEAGAAADKATLRFAVESSGETAREAARENATRMERVIQPLVAAGIARGEIETQNFSVHPEYAHRPGPEGGEPVLTGYRARNEVSLTTLELERVGPLIDIALEAGANRFDGVSFGILDAEPLRAEALRRAVQRARTTAEVIAGSLGVRLGTVLEASTVVQPIQPVMYRFGADMARAEMATTPIQPGEQTVTAQVTVVYRIGG